VLLAAELESSSLNIGHIWRSYRFPAALVTADKTSFDLVANVSFTIAAEEPPSAARLSNPINELGGAIDLV
jgi:hypothetical protein